MFKNCHSRLRLVTFLICCSVCAGADDDVDEPAPKVAPPLVRQRANAGTLLNQSLAQESLNNQLRYKVDEFRANYDLSKAQQAKLSFVCQADVRRASEEVKQIFHGPKFRDVQRNLFGPDSFMAKAMPRILTDEQSLKYRADVDERLRLSHRSNIEGIIRSIERSVVLQIPQQEALVDLLICELPPCKGTSEFEAMLVAYHVSQLPEESLGSVFDDDQWPKVQEIVRGYQQFAPLLRERGLIDGESEATKSSAVSNGNQRGESNNPDPVQSRKKGLK